jgi:amino acid permease
MKTQVKNILIVSMVFLVPAIINAVIVDPWLVGRTYSYMMSFFGSILFSLGYFQIRFSVMSVQKNNATGFEKLLAIVPGIVGTICLTLSLFIFFVWFNGLSIK